MKLYFATGNLFDPPFWEGGEGVHFFEFRSQLDRWDELRDKKYQYSIDVNNVKPFVYMDDIGLWSGSNLAELFLCSYHGTEYPGAFEDQDVTIKPPVIDLTPEDAKILEGIVAPDMNNEDPERFHEFMRWLNTKDYNCIKYLVEEGNRTTDMAFVFDNEFLGFDYDSAEKLN